MLSALAQPAILAALPPYGRSMVFRPSPGAGPRAVLKTLGSDFPLEWGAVGVGESVCSALGHPIPGLRPFPDLITPAGPIPSTQAALWVFLRGPDRATVFARSEQVKSLLAPSFVLDDAIDTFAFGGRDLTGYVDGTENPKGKKRIAVALVADGTGLAGSSFVGVQRWVHDLAGFNSHSAGERDNMIGRTQTTDEELADAPATAHVKRTAQESFDPEAFMLRRSMPWAEAHRQGLEFIAYGRSLDAFDQSFKRMTGLEDGIVDALFSFSTPVTGGYYWCPPIKDRALDLTALGL